jgi:enolase
MFQIEEILARQILDSRGNPTIEVDMYLNSGCFGRASVPSGASKGSREAIELRDGGKKFGGKAVTDAIKNVHEKILQELKGRDVRNQREIDKAMIELDGTENKSNLGANAILACSLAAAKAGADCCGQPLYQYLGGISSYVMPVPSMNVINGGEHAGSEIDIQEHMIMPLDFKTYSEALQAGCEIYQVLKDLLKKKYGLNAINVGDEGGFAPPMTHYTEPFESLCKAIDESGYGKKVKLAIDAAASTFYKNGKYHLSGKDYEVGELVDFYKELQKTYPIISIEDGFAEDDWNGFVTLTREIGNKVQIVGDDLFVTNLHLLSKGVEMGACNALLLKVNQIGTLSESIDAANFAFRKGYGVMVSHRSGETEDNYISDLAVALNAGQIKTGAPARSERCAKYNQLLRIEEELGSQAKYAGLDFRHPIKS